MKKDIHLALTDPEAVARAIHAETGAQDPELFDTEIWNHFADLFRDNTSAITKLDSETTRSELPPVGTLVHFRAMVQVTEVCEEPFSVTDSEGRFIAYSIDEHCLERGAFASRNNYYLVSVPGETAWTKRSVPGRIPDSLASHIAEKYPLPGESYFSCLAKVHGTWYDKFKINRVYDVIGILAGDDAAMCASTSLERDPFGWSLGVESGGASGGTEGRVNGTSVASNGASAATNGVHAASNGVNASNASDATTTVNAMATPLFADNELVPSMYVLTALPASHSETVLRMLKSTPLDDAPRVRDSLVSHLAAGLEGDRNAAEWLIMATMGGTQKDVSPVLQTQHFSLNLALPVDSSYDSARLKTALESVLTSFVTIDLTIPALNDANTLIFTGDCSGGPGASGRLQIPRQTVVLVDMTHLDEGQLTQQGTKSLMELGYTMKNQKVRYRAYEDVYHEIDTSLIFVVLSKGQSFLECDATIQVVRGMADDSSQPTDEATLNPLRKYLIEARSRSLSDVQFSDAIAKYIQSDFVKTRQQDAKFGQNDLMLRLTIAKLFAKSMLSDELKEEMWERVVELDQHRRRN